MLEVKNLSKQYRKFLAVKNLSFTAIPGQVVGLLGPNGAGKTTTMKMLTGFLTPTEGEIHINGINIAKQPLAAKKQIGYLPEGAPSYHEMTVLDFLLFIAAIRGYSRQQKFKVVADIVDKINLTGVLWQTIETLSKGYKCRVGLAQALLHDPKIIILDEPTDGLDPNQKQEIRRLIKEICKDKVIILSTHLLEEVELLCDRVLIINQGKIVVDSTPQELMQRSAYNNTITISIALTTSIFELKKKLTNLAIVSKIDDLEFSNNVATMRLYLTEPNAVAKLCNFIFEQSWNLLKFQVNAGNLQEVFRKATLNSR